MKAKCKSQCGLRMTYGISCNFHDCEYIEKETKMEKKVDVEVEISDEIFLLIAREAHKKDLTFNDMINIILRDAVDKHNPEIIKKEKENDNINNLVDDVI